MGLNGKCYGLVTVVVVFSIIGNPRSVPLLAGFVGLQRSEAILIKNYKKLYVIVQYY